MYTCQECMMMREKAMDMILSYGKKEKKNEKSSNTEKWLFCFLELVDMTMMMMLALTASFAT